MAVKTTTKKITKPTVSLNGNSTQKSTTATIVSDKKPTVTTASTVALPAEDISQLISTNDLQNLRSKKDLSDLLTKNGSDSKKTGAPSRACQP